MPSADKSKEKDKSKDNKDKSKEKDKSKDNKDKSKEKDKSKDISKDKEKEKKKEKKDKSNNNSEIISKIKLDETQQQNQQIPEQIGQQLQQGIGSQQQQEQYEQQYHNQHQMQLQVEAEKVCVHHGLSLTLFCESCEEPICRQCSLLGPHNNQLHRLNNIHDAYRVRVNRLGQTINNGLLSKKDQLLAQIHRVEYRIEEIRYIKNIIERDIRAEYSGMLSKLQQAEGLKTAVLQHQMSILQKDLDSINDVASEFLHHTSNGINNQLQCLQFLLKS